MSDEISSLLRRLEIATTRLEGIAGVTPATSFGAPAAKAGSVETQPSFKEKATASGIDQIIDTKVKPWIELAKTFNDPILTKQANIVLDAFICHRDIATVAHTARQPTTQKDAEGFRELSTILMAANDVAQDNRRSTYFHHLKLVADSLQATTWIMNTGPADYIKSIVGDARIWENKIRREFKSSEEPHVKFVEDNLNIYTELATFTKANFPQELAWDPRGQPFSVVWDEFKQRKAGSASATTGSPAPPPPPPAPTPSDANLDPVGSKDGASGRPAAPPKPPKSPVPPHTKPKPVSMRSKRPKNVEQIDPKKQVLIEFADSEADPIDVDVPLGYSVLISDCKDSTIILHGKVKAVSVNQCQKVNLLVDTVVSSVEVVNTKSFNFQAKDEIAAVQLDRVDSAELYLNKSNTNASIVTSGCVGINVVLLDGDAESADAGEVPIPEQFITTFKDGKLVTEVYRHAG